MPRWTFCPQCDAELFVPDETDRDAWAQCPQCQAVFELGSMALRPLAEVVLVDAPPSAEPATGDRSADKPSAVTLADLMPPARTEVGADQRDEAAESGAAGGSHDQRCASVPARPQPPDEPPASEASEPPAESADFFDDVAKSLPAEETPLPASGWSEGADRLDQWLARVDREAGATAADAPSAELPAGRPVDVGVPVAVSPTPARRRRRSAVRTLVGIMLGGVIGLAAGYYLLLVLGGPGADALELAQYVPSRLLPDSFHSEPIGPTSVAAAPAAAPATPADKPVAAPHAETTAEVPASFAAPVAPPAATTPDDRYTVDHAAGDASSSGAPAAASSPSEPPRFEEPAAVPLDAAEPRVTDAPSYTVDQLRSALLAAQEAKPGLVSGSLDDPAVRRTKGASYTRFCELAEALTYVQAEPPSDDVTALRHQAEQLCTDTLADARTRAEVARIAAIWITSPNRRSGGVVLAGKVIGRSTLGEVDECQFDTGPDLRLTVLVPSRRAAVLDAIDGVVAVVGTIVEAPGERVSGYTGSAPKAVWARDLLHLP